VTPDVQVEGKIFLEESVEFVSTEPRKAGYANHLDLAIYDYGGDSRNVVESAFPLNISISGIDFQYAEDTIFAFAHGHDIDHSTADIATPREDLYDVWQ
jgi:hypothetical protein